MKRTFAFACLAAALMIAGSCAKAPKTGINDASKRYFDAWVTVHCPDAPQTELGSRITSDSPGTGALIGSLEDTPFVYANYTLTDLAGNVSATTDKKLSQQIGTFAESYYYGPTVICRYQGYLSAGITEMMETMRVGGTRTAVIPGWLTSTATTNYFETAQEYIDQVSGTDIIYTTEILEAIPDIAKWETDSLARFMARHYPGVDSTAYGYYYVQTQEPKDTSEFESGTVYINYTGRLLNGQVFDSTIRDTTRKYRIYQDSKTYEPMSLSWPSSDDETLTTSDGGSLIEGFTKCIQGMKAGEKGICFFYSALGYGITGGGSTIPACSPLCFEIEMLGKNEDGSIDTLD
ncbi:MAG: FKBP-type peptidyl-prolyl cis-trans isomerase [Bacteroidales bacterium]|nr:FKBP-type peptidyl-prolyl cis-trans isomerase [Bacteroidales bacterium]